MKAIRIITLCAALPIFLCSCSSFRVDTLKPLVNSVVLISTQKYIQDHPNKVEKILDLASLLEVAANTLDNTLTKEQFVDLVAKVDVEWSILGVTLYDIYSENVKVPDKLAKHSETLNGLAKALRDAVLFTPQK